MFIWKCVTPLALDAESFLFIGEPLKRARNATKTFIDLIPRLSYFIIEPNIRAKVMPATNSKNFIVIHLRSAYQNNMVSKVVGDHVIERLF